MLPSADQVNQAKCTHRVLHLLGCLPANRQGDFVDYIVCPDFFASQTTTPETSRSCLAIPSALSSP